MMHTLAAVLAAATILSAAGAHARPADERGAVVVGGVPVARLRSAGGCPSVAARVNRVYDRLNAVMVGALTGEVGPSDVTVAFAGGRHEVRVGGKLMITALKADAAGTGRTTAQLAHEWASRLRQGLAASQPRRAYS